MAEGRMCMSGGLDIPNHSLRMEDELWNRLGEKVRREPQPAWRSRAAILRAFSQLYLQSPKSIEMLLRDLGDINDLRSYLERDTEE